MWWFGFDRPPHSIGCPRCPRIDQVSTQDPIGTCAEMLGHIRVEHTDGDRRRALRLMAEVHVSHDQ
jgi:hypothetical protein